MSADDKDLLPKYYDRPFKCLESVQRSTDAELRILLSKENGISRDFGSDIYIPSLNSTMGSFMALKYSHAFPGNCESDKTMW